jgi:hypothetical protein
MLGTFRSYDEMVSATLPLKYVGKWTASMNSNCDENAQGKPFAIYMYGLFMDEMGVNTHTGKTTVEGMTVMAVVNAIYNATGVRIRHLPARPEKVLAGLKEKADHGEAVPA